MSRALIRVDFALAQLSDGLLPVEPLLLPLAEAQGYIAADMGALPNAQPIADTAMRDGWALHSLDLVGASFYSPVFLNNAPIWVEIGDRLPNGCDCVLEADFVDCEGPMPQAFAESIPGAGIRRIGEDIASGSPLIIAGYPVSAADILVARAANIATLAVRVPTVRLINLASENAQSLTGELIAELLQQAGARVLVETIARQAQSIADCLDENGCDLIITVGGTGFGHSDNIAEALNLRGALIAHGLALLPGTTTAIGKLNRVPIIALPGLPDQAFATYLTLIQPVLDRLTGRAERTGFVLPLARKIASTVGMTEVALLKREPTTWYPLCVADLLLDHIRQADAWLIIADDSEGHASGASVEGFLLRDLR